MKRYFIGGVILGAAALYFGWMAFCNAFLGFNPDDGRTLSPISYVSSPDGEYTAHLYRDSGGGAAGWSDLFVRLESRGDDKSAEDYDIFFCSDSSAQIDMEWIDERVLQIAYPVDDYTSVMRKQSKHFKEVAVYFKPAL